MRSSICAGQPACVVSDDRALCAVAESLTFFTNRGLDDSRRAVETVTQVDLVPHDSLYRGGDYFLGRSDGDGQVIVQRNEDLDARALDVDAQTVIYVGPTTRADELIEAFASEGLQFFAREA
jgi:hypothetical protein